MTINRDTLREIDSLLRAALSKLEPDGAFRQRVLLQMALFEVDRSLRTEERSVQATAELAPDLPEERSA